MLPSPILCSYVFFVACNSRSDRHGVHVAVFLAEKNITFIWLRSKMNFGTPRARGTEGAKENLRAMNSVIVERQELTVGWLGGHFS